MTSASRNRWAELGILAAARAAMGAQFQVVGALGPLLIGALAADWTELGSLIGAYSLAGVFVALPAGWVMARLGDRGVLLAGVGLMAVGGILLALAPGFALALAGRLVSGVGGALLAIACAKMVLDRFSGATLAPALGLMLMAWPCGIGISLLVLPLLGTDWRAGLWLSALVCAASFLPLWWAPPRGEGPGAAPARRGGLLAAEWAPLLSAGTLWGFYNAAYVVALGFAPAFLVARGWPVEQAGAAASLLGFAILPLLPMGGALAERAGRPVLVTVACILGMAACLVAVAAGLSPWVFLLLFGALTAPPASLVMAMVGRALSPASRAFGMGVHYTLFYGSLALLPPLAGMARDITGTPAAPLWAGVAFLGIALVALAVYVRLPPRIAA
ncbi:MFS transporter [Roseomonas eburnea]|uniref:MFS transporter n=1 Tax=Neoroseomonas eburnea TaxID=1346889 RepID=A0A9X9XJK1_9PROT|nr:MFS transporter [Neoroseomonas eburnea]MBR0683887.1 MFS transporter [Neoroseomonas eburnea]